MLHCTLTMMSIVFSKYAWCRVVSRWDTVNWDSCISAANCCSYFSCSTGQQGVCMHGVIDVEVFWGYLSVCAVHT